MKNKYFEFLSYYYGYSFRKASGIIADKINSKLGLHLKSDQRFDLPGNRTKKGHILLDIHRTNEYLLNKITENKPFMLGKYGSVEAQFVTRSVALELGVIKKIPQKYYDNLYNNAGFFSINDTKSLSDFVKTMKSSTKKADMIGFWGDGMQEYLIDSYGASDVAVTYFNNTNAFNYHGVAWTSALEGKKVLVIHPFSDTILEQYKKRELIWQRKDILPSFDLRVIKAVQTIAGTKDPRFNTWFDALNYMFDQAMLQDFDVALIGCGAYGFPLAAMIKEAGKQAIHLGGVVQAYFGIKGKRFDEYSDFKNNYYNDAWVRPSEEEKPKDFCNVEDGCYW